MVLRHKKYNGFFSGLMIFALLAFVSCSDILSPLNVAPGTSSGQEGEVVVISGSVAADFTNVAGAAPSFFLCNSPANAGGVTSDAQGRMAMPSPTLSENGRSYYVEAYYTDEMQPVEGVVTAGTATGGIFSGTYTIALTTGHKWTVELGVKTQETGESSPTKKLVAKYTYPNNLTAADAATALDLTLRPSQESTGSISLGITFPSSVKHIGLIGFNGDSEENFDVDGTSFSIEKTNIASGAYPATLIFYNSSNSEIYSYDQVINVYDNLATTQWIGDGTSSCPINSSHLFGVTDALIAAYARTNFYVRTDNPALLPPNTPAGSDTTGDGSGAAPYATVSKAISRIIAMHPGSACTIRLLTDISENIELDSTLTTDAATSITIKGYGEQKCIINTETNPEGSSTPAIVRITTAVPIVLENLTIKNDDTAHQAGKRSIGVSISNASANVTLNNCEITQTKGNNNGSAVYNAGTITLNDCTVTGNSSSSSILYNMKSMTLNNCTLQNNESVYSIYNHSNATLLKLGGTTKISPTDTYTQSIYLSNNNVQSAKITLADDFAVSGENIMLELSEYVAGSSSKVHVYRASGLGNAYRYFSLGTSNYEIDSDGKLAIMTNYYVSSSGNSSGNGTYSKPFAKVSEAVTAINNNTNTSGLAFTIHVSGTVKDSVVLNGTTLSNFAGTSIKICGENKATDKIDGSDNGTAASKLVYLETTKPITLENLTLCNLTSTDNSALMISGIGGNVTAKNCNITGNTSQNGTSAINCMFGTISLEDCTITNNIADGGEINRAVLVMGGGSVPATMNVKGNITITGNKQGTGSNAPECNVYLAGDTLVTVNGTLGSGSLIGISVENDHAPTLGGTPVTFTSGLSGKGTTANFVSDNADFSVVTSSGEAALGVSGGTIGGTVFDYAVALSCNTSIIKLPVSSAQTVTVSASITKNGEALPNGETVAIDWELKLLYNGEEIGVGNESSASSSTEFSLSIPTSKLFFMESQPYYTLYATATFNGITYDAEFPIKVFDPLVGFVSVTGATVDGAIGSGDTVSSVFIEERSVTIPNLYVCDHEVTQAEYQEIIGTNPSSFTSDAASGETQAKRPVEKVSWYDAIVYCNKRSIAEGFTPCYTIDGSTNPTAWGDIPTLNNSTWNGVTCNFNANGYRLPTEAEWEYIARGGNNEIPDTQTVYSGSNTVDNVAWYETNSGSKTHEVKKKSANSIGIYDMSGNVREWCWDWYGTIRGSTVATGTSSGSNRILRGGSWFNGASNSCVAYRSSYNPPSTSDNIGFRVVRTRN